MDTPQHVPERGRADGGGAGRRPFGMYRRAELRAGAESSGPPSGHDTRGSVPAVIPAPPAPADRPVPTTERIERIERIETADRGGAAPKPRPAAPRPPRRRYDLAAAAMVLLALPVLALAVWGRGPADDRGTDARLLTNVEAGDAAAASTQRPPDADAAATASERGALLTVSEAIGPEANEAAGASAPATDERTSAAPSTPATRRPVDGRLVVLSEPAGAVVTVNGVGHGRTPVTVRYLPMGDQRIRVTLQGYRSEERVVRLAGDNADRTTRFVLRRWQ